MQHDGDVFLVCTRYYANVDTVGHTAGWVMVSKCSAHSDTALTQRRNDRDDGLTTAGQTATRWKTTEIKLKRKQSGLKKG